MSKTEVEQYEFEEISSKPKIKSAIEALLFVSGESLTIKDLSNSIEVSPKTISNILNEMILDYEEEKRGIKLISINGEYQLVTKAENSDYIQKLLKKNKRQSLSQASLESLAIIAYKQPITRVDIDEIRGVKSESAIHKLLEKDLIKEVGRLEVPGRPILFGTTEEFLRQFGLKELNELPSLDLYSEKDEETIEAMNEIIKEI
ncbi:MAG: SMC-Scp complex subunit ScpB [Clostridium sp.]|uniref:SMC-Scp complex subunit ScpB n=1 Tax=Clostridium sp. TaxID=1506 RepID=UPI001EBCF603|nr:SMC-Scp complex subunit ScpB [Clostridium sp.]MBS5885450.1 segregation/condensation protein B [Clostridium sp.]MDU7149697.1 SMC-Scp complex subunit ScpB [Clostridium sp.]MDU7240662.1 SMC-Scp complex subunit ScpB [Clostridium sp.]